MKSLLKDTRGSMPLVSAGLALVLLLIVFLVAELGAAYENYDHCVDILQRSCNSAVEANIDNAYRADKILKLKTDEAKEDFLRFMNDDLPDRYSVTVESIDCTVMPPSMTVIGTVRFGTLFAQYGWDDLTFGFKVRATNYDLE